MNTLKWTLIIISAICLPLGLAAVARGDQVAADDLAGKDPSICIAVFNQDVSKDPTVINGDARFATPYHAGEKFFINGGSVDPNIVCQHAGGCVPRDALTFPKGCVQVMSNDEYGPYYGWEQQRRGRKH
jgi:hypothetical protein